MGVKDEYAYYNFQPTLSLHYKIKDNFSVRYRLNMYNNVPTLSQLTNVDMIIDSLQIRRGNPDLKPGMSYQNVVMSDFTINKLYLSARIEHWYSPDFIQDKTFFENNKIVRGYTNVDRFKRLTCDIYSRLSLFKDKLVLAANIGMHRYSIGGYVYTVPYYFLNAQFNYKNWQFYAMMYDLGAGFTGETKYINGKGNNLGIQYKKGVFMVGLMLANIFTDGEMKTKNISSIAPYEKIIREKDKTSLLSLKFSMNLDFGRKFSTGYQKISNRDTGSTTLDSGK